MPRTLISNDRSGIDRFFSDLDGQMLYKPLRAYLWRVNDSYRSIATSTKIESLDDLKGADVQASPAIYQEIIEKEVEVRAVFMGRTVLAWQMRPKASSKIDWRELMHGAEFKPHSLPQEIVERCHHLMARLGIVFGCFDFGISSSGEYVFFEVNSGGQFLFGESLCPDIPVLDAFTCFLESKDPKFVYVPAAERLKLSEYLDSGEFERLTSIETTEHFGHVGKFHFSKASVELAV